ncbi:hypothetical protein DNHGIG_38830 [Collibacillus ludicampi]|jgi:hypothetical protein|uniref:Uncharacterized protein n=1 Tax=Collibacillus ludicampi TaxID=2771369 RepID=A0AAV4LKK0_9BACL|nr:hypothetical protein [Collibacillus ludicampi]GIM48334.1 hypothetical protein DNHGIG_38830 [Collibacillus ludicampi]
MIGMLAAVAGFFFLLFMCASLSREKVEAAVRKQYKAWHHD